MKSKGELLEKLEKVASPVIIATEQHMLLLVVLILGVVSFTPLHLLIPAVLRIFTVEGVLFLLSCWFMVITDREQTYWGIFCCVSMWIMACLGIVYTHAVTGHMFEGAGFWDPRRMFFVGVASMAYLGNMDFAHTPDTPSGFCGKDLKNKNNHEHGS
jgi:hypothetical protein